MLSSSHIAAIAAFVVIFISVPASAQTMCAAAAACYCPYTGEVVHALDANMTDGSSPIAPTLSTKGSSQSVTENVYLGLGSLDWVYAACQGVSPFNEDYRQGVCGEYIFHFDGYSNHYTGDLTDDCAWSHYKWVTTFAQTTVGPPVTAATRKGWACGGIFAYCEARCNLAREQCASVAYEFYTACLESINLHCTYQGLAPSACVKLSPCRDPAEIHGNCVGCPESLAACGDALNARLASCDAGEQTCVAEKCERVTPAGGTYHPECRLNEFSAEGQWPGEDRAKTFLEANFRVYGAAKQRQIEQPVCYRVAEWTENENLFGECFLHAFGNKWLFNAQQHLDSVTGGERGRELNAFVSSLSPALYSGRRFVGPRTPECLGQVSNLNVVALYAGYPGLTRGVFKGEGITTDDEPTGKLYVGHVAKLVEGNFAGGIWSSQLENTGIILHARDDITAETEFGGLGYLPVKGCVVWNRN